jgi:hypothetical protein
MDIPFVTWHQDGVQAWADAQPERAVLVLAMRGFVDAGRANTLLTEQILEQSEATRVADFSIDAMFDYRSRRPEMTFSVNEWTYYNAPSLQLDMVMDSDGRPFLLMHGVEPDFQWERLIGAVRDIVNDLGVSLTLGAHGIPMAAPHTRPLLTTIHGTKQDVLPDTPTMFGTVVVPASAHNLLEYRFGEWDLDVRTVVVHVPHYLAQSSYPQAAMAAAEAIEEISELRIDTGSLTGAAETAAAEIERQAGESPEVQDLVAGLERQYDLAQAARDGIGPLGGPLPSAEELGAEFEKFLEQQRRDFPPNA